VVHNEVCFSWETFIVFCYLSCELLRNKKNQVNYLNTVLVRVESTSNCAYYKRSKIYRKSYHIILST
jgi:hypothetical protein